MAYNSTVQELNRLEELQLQRELKQVILGTLLSRCRWYMQWAL
jgi:hypothetical protein